MTKEEREKAINLLDDLIGMIEDDQDDYDFALKKGIEALKREPCEDAVSRASVFEIMGNLMSIPYDFDRTITEKDVSESMDEIRALPPVTLTRKKGHWIMTDDYLTTAYGSVDYVKCSCCGEESLEEGDWCPNCGSFMRGENVC